MPLGDFIEAFVKVVVVLGLWLTAVPVLVYFERKVAAWIQERTGPNRVGPLGILQPVIDSVKIFFKEDVTPAGAHRVLFALAPSLEVFTAFVAIATLPFGDRILVAGRDVKMVVADLEIGILWVFAISALAVYGILLAGWASANHFSFLGGLRSSAQIISYELALTLSVLGVLIATGSLRLRAVVEAQGAWMWDWNCVQQPVGCFVFLVAMFAETNRNPFDLPEAESELVSGYHTEYSSMRFAMFMMAEYVAMVTMSVLMVTLFFGGWKLPGLTLLQGVGPEIGPLGAGWMYGIASHLVMAAKVAFFLLLFLVVRWTLPRFRYDQLMNLGWKGILPLALLQVLASAMREVWGLPTYLVAMAVLLAGIFWFLRTPRAIAQGPSIPVLGGAR